MGYPAGLSFVNYSLKYNIPYLVRCAGSDIQVSDRAKYGERRNHKIDKLIRTNFSKIPFVVSISESVYNEYIKLGIENDSIKSITNGVNARLFGEINHCKNWVLDKYNIPRNYKIFLSVGRNHYKKNFKLLFEIACILKKNGFNEFIFIIIGDNTQSLKDLVTPDLKENFLILGSFGVDIQNGIPVIPHGKLINFYQISDLFVFPSFIETFGIVLVEAMAAGLPIITSDVDGCRDLISNHENGFLCNPEKADEFAEKINKLLSKKLLYREIQNNNKEKSKLYDWDFVVNKYYKLYFEVIKKFKSEL